MDDYTASNLGSGDECPRLSNDPLDIISRLARANEHTIHLHEHHCPARQAAMGDLRPPTALFQLIAKTALGIAKDALALHETAFHRPASRKGRLTFTSTEELAEFILRVSSAIMEDHRAEEHEPALGTVAWRAARTN